MKKERTSARDKHIKKIRPGDPVESGHSLRHQAPPLIWQDGFPVGNGFLGAMIWGDGAPLRFTLDCADLWDSRADDSFWQNPEYTYSNLRRLMAEKRYDEALAIFGGNNAKPRPLTPTKISIGRMELRIGKPVEYTGQLDVDNALADGLIQTAAGPISWMAFAHKTRNVLCVRTTGAPDDSDFILKPLSETCPDMAALNHPPAQRRQDGHLCVFAQAIPDGVCYAVAWSSRGPDFFVAVECAADVETADRKATATWRAAAQTGFDRLREEHEQAWREFWRVSAVHLPEPDMEFMWYYGIYLLGSSARRGAMPPGLQGLWAMDGVIPPWSGDYHLDMNVQETFWPAYASGHMDLADCWCDHMFDCIEPAKTFTRKLFNTEGAFWPCAIMGKFAIPPGNWYGEWYSLIFSWSHTGWLAWMVWLRWRYSLDRDWLARTGYPLLSEMFKFYRDNLVEESDGRLHVPLSTSPEYHADNPRESFCKNPNVDLALIRRCCDWLMEMEEALGMATLTAAARKIKERLVPYALTEKHELCLWPGKPMNESHRHPSHLMAVHPAMDLTIAGNEREREIIDASIKQFLALGQYEWAGHTYAQLISMAAVLGRAGWAYDSLEQFVRHWMMPNGLHCNSDLAHSGMSGFCDPKGRFGNAAFTMEANCGVSAGICDMLVQGWGDTMRVFPAVPEHWREAAFRDLVTEGAFKVSAFRQQGRTVWVRITAARARTLRLRDPFEGAPAITSGGTVSRNGNFYTAELNAGQTIELQLAGIPFDWPGAVRAIRESHPARLGLPRPFRPPAGLECSK